MNNFERIKKKKMPGRKYFFSSTKKGCVDVKKSDC